METIHTKVLKNTKERTTEVKHSLNNSELLNKTHLICIRNQLSAPVTSSRLTVSLNIEEKRHESDVLK